MLTCCCFAFGEREVQSTQPSSLRGAFGKCNPAGKAGLGEEKGDVRKELQACVIGDLKRFGVWLKWLRAGVWVFIE